MKPEDYGLKLNPDQDKVDEIRASLKETKGQCPCVPRYAWTEDTMCRPCKVAKETGECHCGLYVKEGE